MKTILTLTALALLIPSCTPNKKDISKRIILDRYTIGDVECHYIVGNHTESVAISCIRSKDSILQCVRQCKESAIFCLAICGG